ARPDPALGRASVAGRVGPRIEALVESQRDAFDTLVRTLNGDRKAAASIYDQPMSLSAGGSGVALNGPLTLRSTLTENLLLEYTNGMSGNEFGWNRLTPSGLQHIMKLHTTYADLMRRTPYLARVRGSNLLNYVVQSLQQAVTGKALERNAAPA